MDYITNYHEVRKKMKPVRYSAALYFKVEPATRATVEKLAEAERLSMGEAARLLIEAGIEARGRI